MNHPINQWVPFEEGEYLVVNAFLAVNNKAALVIERAMIEVYTGPKGLRQIKGTGMIRPALMVELLEDSDDLDLVLDLGGKYKYYLKKPELQAGKVFAEDVSASIHFYPSQPWEKISEPEFDRMAK
ncbi:Uncharacterized protein dnl_04820 [Desulfonema limicola]|uniref:Uncharacterized protein n=1 Tax=Desulfonema limicola TaxID=45656 RepID=A0A975B3S7_9BACT|nr:hypothetical protein [Desulfonema limicola]QTA78262.1 Uncharacterized protein dnl_04820 [Desulfonema limicola]